MWHWDWTDDAKKISFGFIINIFLNILHFLLYFWSNNCSLCETLSKTLNTFKQYIQTFIFILFKKYIILLYDIYYFFFFTYFFFILFGTIFTCKVYIFKLQIIVSKHKIIVKYIENIWFINHQNSMIFFQFSTSFSSFMSKQCKIHVSNHLCKIHIQSIMFVVCYQKVWWRYHISIRFCARTEITVNAVNVLTVPYDWIYTVAQLFRWKLSYSNVQSLPW